MLFIYLFNFLFEIFAYFMIYKAPCKVMFSPRKINTFAGIMQINDIRFNGSPIVKHVFHRLVWLFTVTNDIKTIKKFIIELEKNNIIDRNWVKQISINYYSNSSNALELYIDENMKQCSTMENNGYFSKTEKESIMFDQVFRTL